MKPLAWKAKYETGNAGMDAEHRLLLGLINNALAHVWDGVAAEQCSGLFMLAENYLTAHHENEEELFASLQTDPEYPLHLAEHIEIVDSCRKLRTVDGQCDGKRTMELVESFIAAFEKHLANDARFLGKLAA